MKKLLAILMAAGLVFSLAACTTGGDTSYSDDTYSYDYSYDASSSEGSYDYEEEARRSWQHRISRRQCRGINTSLIWPGCKTQPGLLLSHRSIKQLVCE